MKQDRFLIGILIGIVVLIVAALAIFFSRQNQQTYLAENSPDGVVHNYVLALLNKDYSKAYTYLAEAPGKPTIAGFRQAFVLRGLDPANARIQIGKVYITGETASVDISTVDTTGDLFSPASGNPGSAQLQSQNGAWKITSVSDYSLWDPLWYQAPPKP